VKPTKFQKQILAALALGTGCVGLVLALSTAADFVRRSPLTTIDNAVTDLAIQIRQTTNQDAAVSYQDIVIVDIDDASIEKIGRIQYWPRSFDAQVINHIAAGKPKSIGIDMLYTETDSLPSIYAKLLAARGYEHPNHILHALSTDDSLRQAIADAGCVYLTLFSDNTGGRTVQPEKILPAFPPLATTALATASYSRLLYPVLPIEPLRKAAKGLGTIYVPSELDGVVRNYNCLQVLPHDSVAAIVPLAANFPLLMAMSELGVPNAAVSVGRTEIRLGTKATIPVSNKSQFRLNWLGQTENFRYISYYKILEGKIPSTFFKDKFVFIGASAAGLGDLKTTPRSSGKIAGVETHATALYNILNNSFFHEQTAFDLIGWFLGLSVLLSMVFMRLTPTVSFFVMVTLGVGEFFLYILYLFPMHRIVLPTSAFLLLLLLCFIATVLYRYLTEEREKGVLKKAFATYVPPDVVDLVLQDSGSLSLGGEKKVLTVLFSDIRSFTTYSERLDPQELVRLLNYYLSRMSDVIFQNKGTIDKFIGDAVMAIFGAPLSQPDHAERACATALAMMNALANVNAYQQSQGQPPLAIGIGINTGDMTVGNIGSDKRFDYTVIGDAVNLASRLEGLNKYFGTQILVSEFTMRACGEHMFVFREVAAVRVKGKEHPIFVFELLALAAEADEVHELLEHYTSGLAHYKSQRFAEALASFVACLAIRKNDGLSTYYIEQCRELLVTPERFSPVVVMDSK
jgi:adenylate cyclase